MSQIGQTAPSVAGIVGAVGTVRADALVVYEVFLQTVWVHRRVHRCDHGAEHRYGNRQRLGPRRFSPDLSATVVDFWKGDLLSDGGVGATRDQRWNAVVPAWRLDRHRLPRRRHERRAVPIQRQ